MRYAGRDLPYRKIALTSFISLSIGHTLGFAAFSSGAVRYRFYAAWGLSAGDVGRIIVFCGFTVLVGLCTLDIRCGAGNIAMISARPSPPSPFAAIRRGEPRLRRAPAAPPWLSDAVAVAVDRREVDPAAPGPHRLRSRRRRRRPAAASEAAAAGQVRLKSGSSSGSLAFQLPIASSHGAARPRSVARASHAAARPRPLWPIPGRWPCRPKHADGRGEIADRPSRRATCGARCCAAGRGAARPAARAR